MEKKYDNTNGGALFPNDRKEKETHPDLRGSINVNGIDYWIKAWKKEAKSGVKFLSLAVNAKEEKPETSSPAVNEDPF